MKLTQIAYAVLTVATLAAPLAARADDCNYDRRGSGYRTGEADRSYRWRDARDYAYNDNVNYQAGHFEYRPVQKWVEGYYQQVWVPQRCESFGRWRQHQRCDGGYYTQQWIPGRYETVSERVWVADPVPPRPPRYFVPGSVSVHFGTRL